jgi:hypothetical protein
MTLISNIFENCYKYLTNSQLIIAFFIYLEFLSIFIEVCIAIHKINGKYIFGLELKNLDLSEAGEISIFYYILYISPYFYVKNISMCDETVNYCYSSYILFAIALSFFILITSFIIISSRENKISALSTEINTCLRNMLGIAYNVLDLGYFKVFGMALLYVAINQVISGIFLLSYGIETGLNILITIFSILFLVAYLIICFCYINWFRLSVQINDFFVYDYMLSKKYDLFILLLKFLISIENNILSATGNLSPDILMLNYFIIGFSFAFALFALFSVINKKVIFINNQNLNKFRLFILIYTNLSCLYLLIFFEDLLTKNIFLSIITSFMLMIVTYIVVRLISDSNDSNLMNSQNLILLFLCLINSKSTDMESLESAGDIYLTKKSKNITKGSIDNNIYQIYILHANKCKEKQCEVCKLEEYSLNKLAAAVRKEINKKLKNGESCYKPEEVEYFKLAELVYLSKNNKDNKLIKLVFQTNIALHKNKSNFSLFNNLSLLNSYLMRDNKEKLKRGFLLQTYDNSKGLAENSIETVVSLINGLSMCNQEDIEIAIVKLNQQKEQLEQNLNLLDKHKNFFNIEYEFILLRVIFQSLFNCKILNDYNIFNFDGSDERLATLFKEKRFLLKYVNSTKQLEIISGSHDYENYNGKQYYKIFPKYFSKTQQKEFIKIIKTNNLSKSKLIQIVEKDNYVQVLRLDKTGNLNIYPSLNQNELYVDFSYKLKSTGLILVELRQDNELNILNYSEDMFRTLYLEIPWLEYLSSTVLRSCLTINNIFTVIKGSNKNSGEFLLELDYTRYSEIYRSIIHELSETSEINISDERVNKYLTEIDYLKFNQGKHVFRLSVSTELQGDNGQTYILYNVEKNETVEKIKTTEHYNEEELEYCYTEKMTSNSSVKSSTKYTDSINTKNIKNNIIGNNTNLKRYTVAFLVLILFLIIYSSVFMVLGINSNNRFQILTDARVIFSRLRYKFSNLSLSLFYSTKIAGVNYNNKSVDIDNYLLSELAYKIEDFKDIYEDFKNLIYQYKAYNDLTYIFDKSYDYEYLVLGDDNKLLRKQRQSTFLEMTLIFINNCKIVQIDLDESELYIVNVTKADLNLPKGVDVGSLKPHILILYQMMKNTDEYFAMFTDIRQIIVSEHTDNLNRIFFYNLYMSSILIGLHLLLVLLCKVIINFIEKIVVKDIALIEGVLHSQDLKFLKIKLNSLKRLAKLYKEKPSYIIEDLKLEYKDYITHSRSEIKFNCRYKIASTTYTKTLIESESVLIKPVKKSYSILFLSYFICAIVFFGIFYSFFNKVEQTRNYLFTNSNLMETVYTSGLLLKFRVLQNFTATGTETDLKAKVNVFFTYVQDNKKSIQQNPIIKEAYGMYENKIANCTTYLKFINDSHVYNITHNDESKLDELSDFCKGTELMGNSLDKIYGNLGHTFFELFNEFKLLSESDIQMYFDENDELDRFIFLVFRPIQYFITNVINLGSLDTVSQTYLDIMIIYLVWNILTEVLLFYLLNKFIIRKSAQICSYYNTLITCLSIV